MAASKALLESIHDAIAGVFLDALTNGEIVEVTGEDGAVTRERRKPSSALLSVIRQFLKDNRIEATPGKGSALGKLAAAFPFPAEDASAEEAEHRDYDN